MTAAAVEFDHDEIRDAVTRIRALADRAEDTLPAHARACVEKMIEETSRNTRDNKPAPIYADFIAAVREAVEHVERVTATVVGNYRTIADALESGNDVSAALADRTAALIADTDTDEIKPGPVLGGAA